MATDLEIFLEKRRRALIYPSLNGKIELKYEDDALWFTSKQIALILNTTDKSVQEAIEDIYAKNEQSKAETMRDFGTSRSKPYYNLPMFLAIGLRIHSNEAIKLRQWAIKILNEIIRFGQSEKIRSQDKDLQAQLRGFIVSSNDYNPDTQLSKRFFQKFNNYLHFAIHGMTASEVIFDRADHKKENMGIVNIKPNKDTITVGTNYLTDVELEDRNFIIETFIVIGRNIQKRNIPMNMQDWHDQLENHILHLRYEKLIGSGTISRAEAEAKALQEYEAFKLRLKSEMSDDSPIEVDIPF
jgi:hypothetical protein